MELKLVHVEAGHPWSHWTLDLCNKSVRRNIGPRTKAPVLDLEVAARTKAARNWGRRKGRLAFPKESFLFASIWMLREDELERLEIFDVRVQDKLVFLYLAHTQTDVEAEGTVRALQCMCPNRNCRRLCPKLVSLDLCDEAERLHSSRPLGRPLVFGLFPLCSTGRRRRKLRRSGRGRTASTPGLRATPPGVPAPCSTCCTSSPATLWNW